MIRAKLGQENLLRIVRWESGVSPLQIQIELWGSRLRKPPTKLSLMSERGKNIYVSVIPEHAK